MTRRMTLVRRRARALPAAALAASLLAGCSSGTCRRQLAVPAGDGRGLRQRRRRRSGGAGRGRRPEDDARGAAVAAARRRAGAARSGALRGRVRGEPRWGLRSLRLADAPVRRGRERRAAEVADCRLLPHARLACRSPRRQGKPPIRPAPGRTNLPANRPPSPLPAEPALGRRRVRAATACGATISGRARWWRASGSRPSSTPTESTAKRPRPGGAGAGRLEAPLMPSGIGRLLELFEGPEAPGPWTPPAHAGRAACAAALARLRRIERDSTSTPLSAGFVVELPPFAGIDTETLGALAGTLADAAPERCTIQIIHWASPQLRRGEPGLGGTAQRNAGGALARMGSRRRDLLAPGGWRRLHDRRTAVHPVGLPRVHRRLPRGRNGPVRDAWPGGRDRTRRIPPRARRHAGLRRSADTPAGAGRAAVVGGGIGGAGYRRIPGRRERTPASAVGAARPAARAMHRAGPGAHGPSDRPHLSPR